MLLPVIAYGALAMMMSVVTRKSAVAIAVTMLIMFGSNILMTILTALSGRMVVPGIKFLLFANTQIENYLPSAQSVFNIGMPNTVDATMTLGFSLAVLAIYAACFLWIARDSFCRRDVK
jgi:ABC-2 type transport system permease protein